MRIRWRRVLDQDRGTLRWTVRIAAFVLRFLWLLLQSVVLRLAHRLYLVKRSRLVRRAYTTMRGWRLDEMRALARDYFDEVIAPRLYPQALKELATHHQAGREVVVVSTNMKILVEHIRRYAPVDDVIAVDFVERDGVLDGTVRGPLWGQEKAEAVRDYAHAHTLSLPRSYAYSDHHSDFEFLRLVGNPVAVNPDLRLRLTGRRRRWPIVRWRPARPAPTRA